MVQIRPNNEDPPANGGPARGLPDGEMPNQHEIQRPSQRPAHDGFLGHCAQMKEQRYRNGGGSLAGGPAGDQSAARGSIGHQFI